MKTLILSDDDARLLQRALTHVSAAHDPKVVAAAERFFDMIDNPNPPRVIAVEIPEEVEEDPWTVAGSNARRANKARHALAFYAELTGQTEADEAECVFKDLLIDLMHLRMDFPEVMDEAADDHASEKADERQAEIDARVKEIMLTRPVRTELPPLLTTADTGIAQAVGEISGVAGFVPPPVPADAPWNKPVQIIAPPVSCGLLADGMTAWQDRVKECIAEAVSAAMEFGTEALTHARERLQEEGIPVPANIETLVFDALKAAGAFEHPSR